MDLVPALSFPEPSELEVRVQVLGIILCDEIEANNSVPRSKDSRKRKRTAVPEEARCFVGPAVESNPILRLSLCLNTVTDADIVRYAQQVRAFAERTVADMPAYMLDAYAAMAKTENHVLQIAAILFFVSWSVACDPDNQECVFQPKDDEARGLLDELGFSRDPAALRRLYVACADFERGKASVTTLSSFVHHLTWETYKTTAPTPPSQRKFSSSSAASSGSKSESSSSSSELSSSHQSSSLSETSSSLAPVNIRTTSSVVPPSAYTRISR